MRPIVDGAPGKVLLLATNPAPESLHGRVPELITTNRRHFSRSRADVEAAQKDYSARILPNR